jgi:hypothetical protein
MHTSGVRSVAQRSRSLGVVGAGLALAVGALVVLPSLAAASTTTVSFSYTGSAQSWTVPAGVSSITVTAYGAQGGGSLGGEGGETEGTLPVSAGQVVEVYVGGQGTTGATSAYPAGGPGGYFDDGGTKVNFGDGGGGYSGVYIAASNEEVLAGGGGGQGSDGYNDGGAGGAGGGDGPGSPGAYSTNPDSTALKGSPGAGASQSAGGGAGGNYAGLSYTEPTAGGNAGVDAGSGGITGYVYYGEFNAGGGGGGGGGFYGGGGGGGDYEYGTGAGGGGGSGVVQGGTVVTSAAGVQSGNGEVEISYVAAVAPAITSASSTTFTGGEASSFTFSATGNPAPSFSESGTLPKGVTLATSGVLSGTPEEEGSFPIVVTAANGVSPDATQDFTLTVTLGSLGVAPEITSASSATFTGGEASSFSFSATGNPAPEITESGTLPKGVSFQGGTGTASISGTPEQDGTFALTLTAANGVSPDATEDFTLFVTPGKLVAKVSPGNATATLTSGVLSFVSPPGNLAFPAITLDGQDQTTTAGVAIGISDGTGSGAGWQLDATSTTFTDGSDSLPASAVSVASAPTVGCDQGATCVLAQDAVSYPYVLPAGTAAPTATALFSAATGTGMGDQTVTPSFSLAVPANAAAGAYSATWTFSLVSGP